MGSKFSPIYATLDLAYLEEKTYEQSEKDFDSYFRKIHRNQFRKVSR